MARAKLKLEFEGMQELTKAINDAGGNVQEAADRALKATHAYITPKLESRMALHHQTGETVGSLQKTADIEWEGTSKASVKVGFKIRDGGLPSIFLMWGTPKRKKSKMPRDVVLYTAAFGQSTKQEVAAIQQQEMEKALREITRG